MRTSTILSLLGFLTISGLSAADQDFDAPEIIVGTPNQDAEPPRIASSGKNVYVIWHEFPAPGLFQPDVFLARSTNRGDSFASRINLSNSALVDSRDEAIAVSGRNVYVTWSENVDQVLFRRSTNNGSSFGTTAVLSRALGAIHPQLVAHDDDVYVVWEAIGAGGDNDIYFAESDDGGNTFGVERNISNNLGPSEFPQLALSGDHVVVTWRDASTPGLDYEIFTAHGR